MNTMKMLFLMALLTVFFVLIGGMIGGESGMLLALVIAGAMNFFSYWFSDKIVLKMYKAKELTRESAPEIFRMTEELTQRAGMPMPKLYMIPGSQPNAFATGRNPQNSAVAVTEGITRLLSPQELRGVIAHELAHIKNRDVLIGTVAATFAGAITYLVQFALIFGRGERGNPIISLAMFIIAPLAAMLVQMAISRSREFVADETGARMANDPISLANALRRLQSGADQIPMNTSPTTAHMFIVNPLRGGMMAKLFSTHPPMDERVKRLEAMVYGNRG